MHDLRARKFGVMIVAILIGLLSRGSLPLAGDETVQSLPKIEPPAWVMAEAPEKYRGFLGKQGLPEPYKSRERPLGEATRFIDFWQANHFLVYRPETAEFLYSDYSSTETPEYVKGALPMFERLVDEHCHAMVGDRDKAVALLREAMPKLLFHPYVPPLGPLAPGDRGLGDEELLESRIGWCNEQARVFVRLCQVAGIPARMIFLFYADKETGHVVAEFYADGRWSMADCTYFAVFPAADGHLMSAAECHRGAGGLEAGQEYGRRYQRILRMSDDEIAGRKFAHIADDARRNGEIRTAAAGARGQFQDKTPDAFWEFGVLNYPLPPAEDIQ